MGVPTFSSSRLIAAEILRESPRDNLPETPIHQSCSFRMSCAICLPKVHWKLFRNNVAKWRSLARDIRRDERVSNPRRDLASYIGLVSPNHIDEYRVYHDLSTTVYLPILF
jgi:hypothetical protein